MDGSLFPPPGVARVRRASPSLPLGKVTSFPRWQFPADSLGRTALLLTGGWTEKEGGQWECSSSACSRVGRWSELSLYFSGRSECRRRIQVSVAQTRRSPRSGRSSFPLVCWVKYYRQTCHFCGVRVDSIKNSDMYDTCLFTPNTHLKTKHNGMFVNVSFCVVTVKQTSISGKQTLSSCWCSVFLEALKCSTESELSLFICSNRTVIICLRLFSPKVLFVSDKTRSTSNIRDTHRESTLNKKVLCTELQLNCFQPIGICKTKTFQIETSLLLTCVLLFNC